jgi:hypothetical protein
MVGKKATQADEIGKKLNPGSMKVKLCTRGRGDGKRTRIGKRTSSGGGPQSDAARSLPETRLRMKSGMRTEMMRIVA